MVSWRRLYPYLFLGNRPDAAIQQVANESGLPIVNLLDEDVYEYYVTGVDEFIWAIEHASLIYTDSFHGTVFSVLFQKPFVVCNRVGEGCTSKMSSRIDTLLSYFELEGRRGTQKIITLLMILCIFLIMIHKLFSSGNGIGQTTI